MARDSKELKAIKIKILNEVIEMLKEESTPTSNLVTYQNVIDTANEMYGDKLSSKVSATSLKNPSSKEFIELKEKIEKFRMEYKSIRTSIPKKSLKEVTELKEQVHNLISEIAKYYDDKLLLNEQLEQKEKTIKKIKIERDNYYNKIKNLEK